jgi:DNA polymerase III sliding clamp (beta) subunit (PCNA family)
MTVLNSQQISLEVNDTTKPALLRSVGDDSFFYIIMPVRPQS